MFIQSDELGRAEECVAQLKKKEISPAFVAFLEGLIADRRDQYYDAVKFWQRSVELGNRSLRIRLALTTAYSRLGDTRSALRQLETLVTEMPIV